MPFMSPIPSCSSIFFSQDTATTEIYTLSLHDALPIFVPPFDSELALTMADASARGFPVNSTDTLRSEEHTSELQSRQYLVCRLLLEKKKMSRSSNTSIRIVTLI